jgi:hypothetical protein
MVKLAEGRERPGGEGLRWAWRAHRLPILQKGGGFQEERALEGRHLNWSPNRAAEVGFTHTLILSSMEHEW